MSQRRFVYGHFERQLAGRVGISRRAHKRKKLRKERREASRCRERAKSKKGNAADANRGEGGEKTKIPELHRRGNISKQTETPEHARLTEPERVAEH